MKRKRGFILKLRQLMAGNILLFLAALAIISGIIYSLFFTQWFFIGEVSVETEYKDINVPVVQKYIEENALGKNTLTLPLMSLESDTYSRFPDVSSVSCSRDIFSKRLNCEVLGYELVAVIKHEGNKYYINENGVVIAFDNRKLGLPIFDLILNPVFADIESQPDADVLIADITQSLESTVSQSPFGPFYSSMPPSDQPPSDTVDDIDVNENDPGEAVAPEASRLSFIQPSEAPPIEPLIMSRPRDVFQVAVGKKILDPDELRHILEAIAELEKVLGRKVINAQYVQVAGELSLSSTPQKPSEANAGQNPDEAVAEELMSGEEPEHEFTILLDLRRNVDDQFVKLKKSKEVIDFTQVRQIDLSIDGEKVFYR